mmetsp:Transcript_28153/g.45271  ORF Transcript_28153/g.45271 Transcript_28153/m.45271 type:complete len:97 (+) Transcript_28153:301-591(+)
MITTKKRRTDLAHHSQVDDSQMPCVDPSRRCSGLLRRATAAELKLRCPAAGAKKKPSLRRWIRDVSDGVWAAKADEGAFPCAEEVTRSWRRKTLGQ